MLMSIAKKMNEVPNVAIGTDTPILALTNPGGNLLHRRWPVPCRRHGERRAA